MKHILVVFLALLHLSAWAQTGDFPNRKPEIETCMAKVYSVTKFQRIADSLQLSLDELSDYPVIFPMKQSVISSGFGMRKHPIRKLWHFHTGIDLPKVQGTAIYATGNGVVTRKGYNSGYGNYIEIQHAGGFRSFYAHLNQTFVNTGDSVYITQQIACVGNTGISTGSHLHYEIRKGYYFLNPREWCGCLLEVLKNR